MAKLCPPMSELKQAYPLISTISNMHRPFASICMVTHLCSTRLPQAIFVCIATSAMLFFFDKLFSCFSLHLAMAARWSKQERHHLDPGKFLFSNHSYLFSGTSTLLMMTWMVNNMPDEQQAGNEQLGSRYVNFLLF